LELKPVGTLEVKLVQARDLTNKDLIGKSDPFAIVYVRPLPDKMKRSKTIVSTVFCYELLSFGVDSNHFNQLLHRTMILTLSGMNTSSLLLKMPVLKL
jgi:Ca2+-dependent lipid-binding protein